jgi:cell division protein FtsI (penicillin-binding protein 3)
MSNNADIKNSRITYLLVGFLLFMFAILLRLYECMIGTSFEENVKIHFANSLLKRGKIIDRHGYVLATNVPIASIYANPKLITNPDNSAKKIVESFPELDYDKIKLRLKSKKGFVWIKRDLSPKDQERFMSLGIPGFYLKNEDKRLYPYGHTMSHVVGSVGIDSNGLDGLEKSFDRFLKEDGEDLYVSLSLPVQHAVRVELEKAVEKFQAKGGCAVVYSLKNGEIISAVSLPDYNPNSIDKTPPNFFRITRGLYEMGSIMKSFTITFALFHGTHLGKKYDATRPIFVCKKPIKDYKGKGRFLTLEEIFVYSSNIGTTLVVLDLGPKLQREFMTKLGLLSKIDFDVPVAKPFYLKTWTDLDASIMSYGYGFAITPIHAVSALGAVVHGKKYNPTLILNKKQKVELEFDEKIPLQMQFLFRKNALFGSGKNGVVDGYMVGGKTGTKNVIEGKHYKEGLNLTYFVAIMPSMNPEYLVYVMLDEPKAIEGTHGYTTSGWNVAPTTSNIIKRIAPILGVEAESDSERDGILFKEISKQVKYTSGVKNESR